MPSYILCLLEDRLAGGATAELAPGQRMVYAVEGQAIISADDQGEDSAADSAWFGTGRRRLQAGPQGARLYRWELGPPGAPAAGTTLLLQRDIALAPDALYLMRCDRVDFPPGGIAYTHTHPGPGIRCLLEGTLNIESQGQATLQHPGDAWFERGPDPVLATASSTQPTSFVRGMILPRALQGKSSIQYVRAADAAKPKPQRYTRFVDEFIDLP